MRKDSALDKIFRMNDVGICLTANGDSEDQDGIFEVEGPKGKLFFSCDFDNKANSKTFGVEMVVKGVDVIVTPEGDERPCVVEVASLTKAIDMIRDFEAEGEREKARKSTPVVTEEVTETNTDTVKVSEVSEDLDDDNDNDDDSEVEVSESFLDDGSVVSDDSEVSDTSDISEVSDTMGL
ncbi:hypothetical protein M0R19_03655 [Candidatus Pacearchaeota archaeon]|jgi:hypothetical protein|nr:hypothetical protein [Candidatus Pacearchaeota archaeon]